MESAGRRDAGAIVRSARQAAGLTLLELGRRTGYSPSQVSRYERGIAPLTDTTVLRRFAHALALPPQAFGLLPDHHAGRTGAGAVTGDAATPKVICKPERKDGDDPVRRRQLLANLVITAAASAGTPMSGRVATTGEPDAGELLVARVRDAMLGTGSTGTPVPAPRLRTELATALADYHACRYRHLTETLPHLITSGHALTATDAEDEAAAALLAETYTLTTRMLIKLDAAELGWMAADRARLIAAGAGAPLVEAEAARNLAVLARRAGWHDQAAAIALAAADHPGLRGNDRRLLAERGLLIQSAAYTMAKRGDADRMRELTGEAASIAARLGGATVLRDHGGGFSTATVRLHAISAETSVGDSGAALATARHLAPQQLPSTERRARYHTDVARAHAQHGHRDQCLQALLAAERHAPEETHTRPAVRDLISGLLLSGPTTFELRGLAARCGVA
jgi:transcriptional regulator with XRE-family HTH domain